MRAAKRLCLTVAAVTAGAALGAGSAQAAGSARAVFVQTDNPAGNQIVAYDRAPNGTLSQAAVYDTGGLGGQLEGSVVDHLASQGSLAYDRANGLLYAVNAASNTVSVFAVFGDRLALRQVLPSGGTFPASIAVQGDLVYVLDAEQGGAVAGFRVQGGRLVSIPGSVRSLELDPLATPQFTHTPGQVAFTPDGSHLLVTTKGNGSAVEMFSVSPLGLLGSAPVLDAIPGAVPFAVTFDGFGHLILAEAGPSALASFQVREDGSIAQLDAVATGQAATCWVVRIGRHLYASNAGSASLSAFQEEARGQVLAPIGTTATDAGTVDAAASPDAGFLYVQTGGAGILDEFAVGAGGTLTSIGSVTVPGAAGGEGIVAK